MASDEGKVVVERVVISVPSAALTVVPSAVTPVVPAIATVRVVKEVAVDGVDAAPLESL